MLSLPNEPALRNKRIPWPIDRECSYYGGGSPLFWGGVLPYRTEKEQDEFSRRFIAAGTGSVGGWLNWPLQDTRESTDTSAYGGFYTAGEKLKPWGKSFRAIAARLRRECLKRVPPDAVLPVSRTSLLTDAALCDEILQQCHKLHLEGTLWDFEFRA